MTTATPDTQGSAVTLPGNNLGRLICLTLFTPVRRVWFPVLAAGLWIAKWVPFAQRHILQFNFIHFVRWTLVSELPRARPGEERERLNYPYLFFESNFDGPWQHYIDAFAYCIPKDIQFCWGRGPAFPDPPPAEPLKNWIAMNTMEGGSYYCAYPESSTRMVMSAVAVKDALGDFVANSADLGSDEFKVRYDRFLTDIQGHL
jgi:hypothetical protein